MLGGLLGPEHDPLRKKPTPQAAAVVQGLHTRLEVNVGAVVWYCVAGQFCTALHAVAPAWSWNPLVPSHATQVGVVGGRVAPEHAPVRNVPTVQLVAVTQLVQTRSDAAVGALV